MAFIEKVKKSILKQSRQKLNLSAEALRLKERRDRELADIISGEDDRILLVIGPCSSDMKRLSWNMPAVYPPCKRRWRTRFHGYACLYS